VIGVKWVYRTKLHPNGSIHKHKTRLVVQRYSQMDGIDYGDTFAPTARHETIRLIVALSSRYGWKILYLDSIQHFHMMFWKKKFMLSSLVVLFASHEEKVYRLHKVLHGVKQAPRAQYSRLDSFFFCKIISRVKMNPLFL